MVIFASGAISRFFAALLALAVVSVAPICTAEVRHVHHRYGVTQITGAPERVVSLSFIGHDYLLGLGVVPIGVRYWYGDHRFGVWPWAQVALGNAEPEVIYGTVDIEAIALLEPDLIEAQWSGITKTEYRLLSQIAPTLAPPVGETHYSASWQDMTRQIGIALGKEPEALEQIASIEQRMSDIKEAHPQWLGQTAAVVWPSRITAYSSEDIRQQLLANLGFSPSEEVEAMAGPVGYSINIPQENLPAIDTNVLLWLTVSDPTQELARIKLHKYLRAHKEGREIVVDPILSAAMSHSSPLALNFVLDHLPPLLAAASDGDLSTPVPLPEGFGQ